jgi:hypothetical protein
LYSPNGEYLGEINANGQVYAANFTYVGKFEGNRFYDANFNYVGELRDDGSLVDANFVYRGRIANVQGTQPQDGISYNPDFTQGTSFGYPFGS